MTIRITPTRPSFAPGGPPPSFRVETGDRRHFAVQVATDAFLLNGAAAARRTPRNFFDSWIGDDRWPPRSRVGPAVPAQRLEAETGRATYTLPAAVWSRLAVVTHIYYRALASSDPQLRRPTVSVADVDWTRAPALPVSRLPVLPARSPVARFRGRGALSRSDFLDRAREQLGDAGLLQGRDGDFHFAVLDARRFHMTVVECHEWGLTDTVDEMPRKPGAVINGQFIARPGGIATEGQVIREGQLINADPHPSRYYIAQTWRGADVSDYRVGEGDPATEEPQARVAFGGLGPVLLGGAPVGSLTAWARSIYDRPAEIGRGVVGVDRGRGLLLLLVQEHAPFFPTNVMTMPALRDRLLRMGVDDAVFNDGSDSESLFAGGGWAVSPAFVKDESMDFAIAFVDRQRNQRLRLLAIDGTKTADGETFTRGINRPLTTHYSPRNISADLRGLAALASVSGTIHGGVIQAWRATTSTQAGIIGQLIEQAGAGGHWADLFYVSSHAWRHGQLWFHQDDDDRKALLMLADPWAAGFRPVWRTTPRWLVLAGCAVLGLRYSRGRPLDATERAHLVDWHRDMHGASATVPGLTPAQRALFAVYHPGWAWYQRVFAGSPSLRGVLGYWYRSPGAGRDVEIMEDFSTRLSEGETILEAWEAANRRGWFEASAAWAALVRPGCDNDSLATLEDTALPAATGPFKYYDRFQSGQLLVTAYRHANRLTDSARVGSVSLRFNADYDALAVEELRALTGPLTPATFLEYQDGIGP